VARLKVRVTPHLILALIRVRDFHATVEHKPHSTLTRKCKQLIATQTKGAGGDPRATQEGVGERGKHNPHIRISTGMAGVTGGGSVVKFMAKLEPNLWISRENCRNIRICEATAHFNQ